MEGNRLSQWFAAWRETNKKTNSSRKADDKPGIWQNKTFRFWIKGLIGISLVVAGIVGEKIQTRIANSYRRNYETKHLVEHWHLPASAKVGQDEWFLGHVIWTTYFDLPPEDFDHYVSTYRSHDWLTTPVPDEVCAVGIMQLEDFLHHPPYSRAGYPVLIDLGSYKKGRGQFKMVPYVPSAAGKEWKGASPLAWEWHRLNYRRVELLLADKKQNRFYVVSGTK